VDAALIGASEQRILAVERDRTDRALDHVGMDLDPAVVEEAAFGQVPLKQRLHAVAGRQLRGWRR